MKFEHATGYKTNGTNMANYGLRLYQARHVQGIIAGMMTKQKICYVALYPKLSKRLIHSWVPKDESQVDIHSMGNDLV